MKKEVRQGAGKSFFIFLSSQKYSDVLCALILQKGSIFFLHFESDEIGREP